MKKYRVFPIVIILLTCQACSSSGLFATPTMTPTTTQTFTPSPTSTPTMTSTPTIQPPGTPEPGFSNVYGRVLWHGEPVVGIGVYLSDYVFASESYYQERVETDDDGRFVFTLVPPGDGYEIGPRSGDLLDLQEQPGFESAQAWDVSLSVPAGTNFNFGEYYLVDTLSLVYPEKSVVLDEMPASLKWEPYPEAAYYSVSLGQSYGTYTNLTADVEQSVLDLKLPLLDCTYHWTVVAYNADRKPIAASDPGDRGVFTIRNDMLPWCELRYLTPGSAQHVSAGLSQIGWELHPLAASYEITMTKTTGALFVYNPITRKFSLSLDYKVETGWYIGTIIVNEDGTLANPDPPLPYIGKGQYEWKVKAYTAEGDYIAGGSTLFFVP